MGVIQKAPGARDPKAIFPSQNTRRFPSLSPERHTKSCGFYVIARKRWRCNQSANGKIRVNFRYCGRNNQGYYLLDADVSLLRPCPD
jgi:hypothetical protein